MLIHKWEVYLKTKQMVSQAEIWIRDGTARLHSMDDLDALRSAQEREFLKIEKRFAFSTQKNKQ
jgi:hypothetical protein